MKPPASLLDGEAVQRVLAREHENARDDSGKLEQIREKLNAAKAAGENANRLYPNTVYLAVEPAMGRFLYLAAKATGARNIVEFGSSFGISTIYLAAAAAELGGKVTGSELEPEKTARAQANLKEAGLAKHAEIRQGDALETLKSMKEPVDLLFLDGWKDLYEPVLDMMRPRLAPGALVLADNIHTFPEELKGYVEKVSRAGAPYMSVIVPFESGLAYSIYTGDGGAETEWPAAETGAVCGLARKAKRRAPIETLEEITVTVEGGLEGDNRGRFSGRAVTVLAKEAWEAALRGLDLPLETPWTIRRANLLTEGISLPRAAGGVLQVGEVFLEVTGETRPCSRMEKQQPGLLKALGPNWRRGVTCRVLKPGTVRTGDFAQVLLSPPERSKRPLP